MIPTTTTTIVGNLTRDPELRYTPNGTAVARFGVAVNTRRKDDSGTYVDADPQFYNVTTWRDLAVNVSESVEKGTRVVIVGHLSYRAWEDDDKNKRSAVEVVADAIGPDLTWATASVAKTNRRSVDEPQDYDPAEEPF